MQKIQAIIDTHIRTQVQTELEALAHQHQVTIISAIESGSRSWGFPSLDSDYDVRFIYVHKPDWYIQLSPERDVIERPIDAVLDIGGWDVRKAMQLANSGNMIIQEWLISSLVYQQEPALVAVLRDVIARAFSSKAAYYHYSSMAKHMMPALDESPVKLKKFFYISRAVLSALWVIREHSMPTTVFPDLLAALTDDKGILSAFQQQIADKKTKNEAEMGEVNPVCLAFIKQSYDDVMAASMKRLPARCAKVSNENLREFLRLTGK